MTVDTPIGRARTGRPIDELTINTIRTLSMDAVQAANSGHPGTPMALAPVAYTLWQYNLRFDPDLPVWANRDRFVLSVGHASAADPASFPARSGRLHHGRLFQQILN